jgi:hypothetical protein
MYWGFWWGKDKIPLSLRFIKGDITTPKRKRSKKDKYMAAPIIMAVHTHVKE